MRFRIHKVLTIMVLVALLCVSMWLLYLSQAQGLFDDDDPSNDPNACHSHPDPANCDWRRGWYQAAVNLGHLSLEQARLVYPDMQYGVTILNARALYDDDDPKNDPNICYDSPDPDCDWERGWQLARQTHMPVQAAQNQREIQVRQAQGRGSQGGKNSDCVPHWTVEPGWTCWRQAPGERVQWRKELPLGEEAQATREAEDELWDIRYMQTAFALVTSIAKGTSLPPLSDEELAILEDNPHTLCINLRCMATDAAEEATFRAQ